MVPIHFLFLIQTISSLFLQSIADDVLNAYFSSNRAAFFTDTGSAKESSIYSHDFVTPSNTDVLSLRVEIGNLKVNTSIDVESNLYHNRPLTTVHLFQNELRDDYPTLHFLCHSVINSYSTANNPVAQLSTCCIIKVTANNRHFFTGCLIDNWSTLNVSTCHASIQIENRVWNDSQRSELDISYRINTVQFLRPSSMNILMESAVLSRQCLTPLATQLSDFKFLKKIPLKHIQPDEIREIGRNVLLDIPARKLKNGEFFTIPVRVKQYTDIAEFTLRCVAPTSTYVEFVRVVWPWETDETSQRNDRNQDFRRIHPSNGPSSWDIAQRHIPGLKGTGIEVVARYRESSTDINIHETYRDDPIIYKLLFRVVSPPKDSPDRVGPRLLWSLISLSRRNTVDQAVSGSPIVTRLNIESLIYKYLTLVLKHKSLVNTAVLSGIPTRTSAWVYGLTHSNELEEVTSHTTCHTNDDTVVHFPRDSCSEGLLFSGGELSGSPGLTLVAKLNRTSAEEELAVWFPNPHAVSLVVDTPKSSGLSPLHECSTASIILRSMTDHHQSADSHSRSSASSSALHPTHFQQTRLRTFARFTLSSNDYGAEESLGGQSLDVTELTAHRLRLEYADVVMGVGDFSILQPSNGESNSLKLEPPARLVIVDDQALKNGIIRVSTSSTTNTKDTLTSFMLYPARVWIIGRRPGRVRVKLSPVSDSPLVKAALPQSLAKLRKQRPRHHPDLEVLGDPQQILCITVTDSDSIWPSSLTVQLVTDLTVTITKKADRHIKPDRSRAGSYFASESDGFHKPRNSSFAAASMGIYTAHVRFFGSRVGRSKTAPHDKPAADAPLLNSPIFERYWSSSDDRYQDSPSGNGERSLKRLRRQPPTRALPRQGLLVVSIQFSDGSVLPWHRIMEVTWELGLLPPPYSLVVENMRPDLVRVDMPSTLPPSPSQVGEASAASSREGAARVKRDAPARGSDWLSFSPDQPHPSNSSTMESPLPLKPEWLGPTVVLLREDESFIGDLLKVSLYSASEKKPLFTAPVHASIVAARPSRRTGNDLPNSYAPSDHPFEHWVGGSNRPVHAVFNVTTKPSPVLPEPFDRPPSYWSDPPKQFSPDGIYHTIGNQSVHFEDSGQLGLPKSSSESNWKFDEFGGVDRAIHPNSPHSSIPSKSRTSKTAYEAKLAEIFGSPALKDAPGLRSPPGYRKSDDHVPISGFSADKTKKLPPDAIKQISRDSVKKVDSVESPSVESGDLTEAAITKDKTKEANASRPALELTMYILLGLFVLIALIFAVNCGAMVARYRWEHARGAKETYRLHHLSELAMNSSSQDDSGLDCIIRRDEITGSQSDLFNEHLVKTEEATVSLPLGTKRKGFLGLLLSAKKKLTWSVTSRSELINRDTDWVWLGRTALEEREKMQLEQRQQLATPLNRQPSICVNETSTSGVTDPLLALPVTTSMATDDSSTVATCYILRPPSTVTMRSTPSNTGQTLKRQSASSGQTRSSSICNACHIEGDEYRVRVLDGSTPSRQENRTPTRLHQPKTGHRTALEPDVHSVYGSYAHDASTDMDTTEPQACFVRVPKSARADFTKKFSESNRHPTHRSSSQRHSDYQAIEKDFSLVGDSREVNCSEKCGGGGGGSSSSRNSVFGDDFCECFCNDSIDGPSRRVDMTSSTPSPWVYRKYHCLDTGDVTPRLVHPSRSPVASAGGYQTLSTKTSAWQEKSPIFGDRWGSSECGSPPPPRPPVRTSSKLPPDIACISPGVNFDRPTCFLSQGALSVEPLMVAVNAAANDIYGLLGSSLSKRSCHSRSFRLSRPADPGCSGRTRSCNRLSWSDHTPDVVNSDKTSTDFQQHRYQTENKMIRCHQRTQNFIVQQPHMDATPKSCIRPTVRGPLKPQLASSNEIHRTRMHQPNLEPAPSTCHDRSPYANCRLPVLSVTRDHSRRPSIIGLNVAKDQRRGLHEFTS